VKKSVHKKQNTQYTMTQVKNINTFYIQKEEEEVPIV
jgi:hypothetical protein